MSCRKVKSGGDKCLLLTVSSHFHHLIDCLKQAALPGPRKNRDELSRRQFSQGKATLSSSFAAYNLIVSQGRQLTQGPFSNGFPTIFHLLRNYFRLFTYKLTLFDNKRCHFNKLSWLSQPCHDLPSRRSCFL